jgi:hypothetical protein
VITEKIGSKQVHLLRFLHVIHITITCTGLLATTSIHTLQPVYNEIFRYSFYYALKRPTVHRLPGKHSFPGIWKCVYMRSVSLYSGIVVNSSHCIYGWITRLRQKLSNAQLVYFHLTIGTIILLDLETNIRHNITVFGRTSSKHHCYCFAPIQQSDCAQRRFAIVRIGLGAVNVWSSAFRKIYQHALWCDLQYT